MWTTIGILLMVYSTSSGGRFRPHIIMMMADDLGFGDISFHGSDQIPTPNIDALLTYGIAMNRFYTAPMCSPSRASLMTGKYPSNLGMQQDEIHNYQPWGLNLKERTLPEYLKTDGYATHMIGKWHLGFYKENYTPNERGFDSFFGFLGSHIDYYTHISTANDVSWKCDSGYDMRQDRNVTYDSQGTYATDLFTNVAVDTIMHHNYYDPLFMYLSYSAPHFGNEGSELQAPADELAKFSYITDEKRRTYAAMVSKLDAGVGRVVVALRNSGMLQNSIIIFLSDNGSPISGVHWNAGSNYPFRGQKDSPWEGAVRGVCGIWSPYLRKMQRVSNELYHISDWLPTLANIVSVSVDGPLDGKNIWDSLSLDINSPRNEVLCNIDKSVPYSSLVKDQWKYVNGTTYKGVFDDWLSDNVSRYELNPGYNNYAQGIMCSDVGAVLSRYSYSCVQGPGCPLSSYEIDNIRAQGKITCNNIPIPSAGPSQCNPLIAPCLFNIINDPCERINLASTESHRTVFEMMERRVQSFDYIAVEPRIRANDPRSNPGDFNGTWTWWFDALNIDENSPDGARPYVMESAPPEDEFTEAGNNGSSQSGWKPINNPDTGPIGTTVDQGEPVATTISTTTIAASSAATTTVTPPTASSTEPIVSETPKDHTFETTSQSPQSISQSPQDDNDSQRQQLNLLDRYLGLVENYFNLTE